MTAPNLRLPTVDGEPRPLCQFRFSVTYTAYEPMSAHHNGAGRAVANAARGQLYRTLMDACPSDHMDVSWPHARCGGGSIHVPIEGSLIRVDDPETYDLTSREITNAIHGTAESLSLEPANIEVSVAELLPSETEQLVPDPTEDAEPDGEDPVISVLSDPFTNMRHGAEKAGTGGKQ